MRLSIAVSAMFSALMPVCGHAASYRISPFTIPGASSVSIAAVNDFGVAAGTYVSPAAPYGAGFSGKRGKITVLPVMGQPTYSFVPVPTGIDNSGNVLVTVYKLGQPFGYTWQSGSYQNFFTLGYGYQGLFPPFLGNLGQVSYNADEGDGQSTAFAGPVGSATALPNNGTYPQVASINKWSQIAGQFTKLGSKPTTAVFVGTVRKVVPLLPPSATASFGGWLNDLAQVGGSYSDASGALHGFIFQKGSYTSFDLPTPPTVLTVQGIDMAGRVIGAYTDSLRQYGFVYTRGTVVKLGTFPKKTTVQLSISHFGHVIAMTATSGTTSKAYLVRCTAAPNEC